MKRKHILIITLCSLAGCFLLCVILSMGFINQRLDRINYVTDTPTPSPDPIEKLDDVENEKPAEIKDKENNVPSNRDTYNMLFIGTDDRARTQDGRSDSMIIVSINPKEEKIKLISLLRDIYVDIPNFGKNRLNAAYSFGGAPLLLETIEANFGISIEDYAIVNFYSFVDIIDAIGGITLAISEDELDTLNGYMHEINRLLKRPMETDEFTSGGILLMNGKQALCYSRNRNFTMGDFSRTQRQQIVIEKILDKVKELSLTQLSELKDTVLEMPTTNIPKSELLEKALELPIYLGYEIENLQIPIKGSYEGAKVNHMSVIRIDFEKNKEALMNAINAEEEEGGE